jgi:divinyl protochlorophyllide a 8-vinyl-reductase
MSATTSTSSTAAARIGPNAIIRTVEALRERIGTSATADLLVAARLERYGTAFPTDMVPEEDVGALYRALRAVLDAGEADASARLAGVKTADYLLAYRIPKPAQVVLRALPGRFAAPILLSSITKHTWTFAGSGVVDVGPGPPVRIAITGCPICRDERANEPLCGYYAATFERLFTALVSRRARAVETACAAVGAPSCRFEIRY